MGGMSGWGRAQGGEDFCIEIMKERESGKRKGEDI